MLLFLLNIVIVIFVLPFSPLPGWLLRHVLVDLPLINVLSANPVRSCCPSLPVLSCHSRPVTVALLQYSFCSSRQLSPFRCLSSPVHVALPVHHILFFPSTFYLSFQSTFPACAVLGLSQMNTV